MGRITDNEAVQAAKALKEYCASHTICDGCVFRKPNPYKICGLTSPPIWSIPDPVTEPPDSKDSKRLREREEFFSGTYEEQAQRREDDAQERYLSEWKARNEK